MQGREVLAHSPSGIRLVHRATKERPVELGQSNGIGTVDDEALQIAYHTRFLPAALSWPSIIRTGRAAYVQP